MGWPCDRPRRSDPAGLFVWRAIGEGTFGKALEALRVIEQELRVVNENEQFRGLRFRIRDTR